MKKWLTLFFLLIFAAGCASDQILKGVDGSGKKIYLGNTPPTEQTDAYQAYLRTSKTEADKQRYLFQRLKNATHLTFYHEGNWYNSVQAYRGGMWLMRNRYKKDQLTRDFIKKFVERSEDKGEFHLAKFPDGTIHIGSYLLFNELDWLEERTKR